MRGARPASRAPAAARAAARWSAFPRAAPLLLALAPAAAAQEPTRIGTLVRWYLREESPARRQDLLEAIERAAQGDPRPVAEAIRRGEHLDRPERPALRTGGKHPVFDLGRPRLLPVEECAGDFAQLVLPDGYSPSHAHPLVVELSPLGLPPPPGALVLRVRTDAHARARESAEAADLLVLSLVAHVTEIAHVDPRRVFLFAGDRPAAELAWYVALHNPDRFAGVLAGPGAWEDGSALAANASLFTSVGILSPRADRGHEAFLERLEPFGSAHRAFRSQGDPAENRRLLAPVIESWWEGCARPPAPRRIRLVNDRGTAVRAYWLRMAPRVPSLRQDRVGRPWTQRVLAQHASIEAEIGDVVDVRAERVLAFDLWVDPALFEPGSVVRVRINGRVPEARVARGDIQALLDDYRERRDPDLLYFGKMTFTVP